MKKYAEAAPIAINFTVDVDQGITVRPTKTLTIQQGEHNARYFQVSLVHDDMPVNLANSEVHFLTQPHKSDEIPTTTNCEIYDAENGQIMVAVKDYMSNKKGIINGEFVRVGKDGSSLPFKNFTISVDGSIFVNDGLGQSEPLHSLVSALARVQRVEEYLEQEFMDVEAKYAGELSKTNAKLTEVANKGTTVEVLERVTKEEIDRKIEDGTIANLTIAEGSITKDKLDPNIKFGTDDGEVTYNKTNFIKAERINYFNMDTVDKNSTMSNGVVTSFVNWVSDYIEGIEPDTVYSFFNLNPCNTKVAEYTSDNAFIKQQNWVSSVTTSSNCRKVRIETVANNTKLMMVKGNTQPSVFSPYSKMILHFEENLSDEVKAISKEVSIETVNQMPLGAIKSENTNFIKNYKNLWVDNNVVNEYLNISNGTVQNNLGYSLNFTEVYENACYVANFKAPMLCYREDKTFIAKVEATGDNSGWLYGVRKYTTPNGTKYIRFNKHVAKPVLIQGDTFPIEYNYSSNAEPKRRLPNDDMYVLEGNLDLISAQVTPFYNKKIGFLGDSITAGSYAGQNYGDSTYANVKTYHDLLSDVYYFVNVNYGIGGTGFTTNGGSHTTFYERVEKMSDDLDIIVVYGGWNDRGYVNTSLGALGTIEDKTPDTFYGAVQHTVKLLKEKYPNKPIVFMTHFKDTAEIAKVNKAIKEVCLKNYINVIDLSNTALSANDEITIKYYFKGQDGVHPNTSGHRILAQYISKMLKEIILF